MKECLKKLRWHGWSAAQWLSAFLGFRLRRGRYTPFWLSMATKRFSINRRSSQTQTSGCFQPSAEPMPLISRKKRTGRLIFSFPMCRCGHARGRATTLSQRPVFWWVSRRRWATKARLRRKDSDPNQSVGPAIGYSRRHGGRHSAANCGPLCHRRTR